MSEKENKDMKTDEELWKLAEYIQDYKIKNKDYARIFSSLTKDEERRLIPMIKEVTRRQIEAERKEFEKFMDEEKRKNEKVWKFIESIQPARTLQGQKNTRLQTLPDGTFFFIMGEA